MVVGLGHIFTVLCYWNQNPHHPVLSDEFSTECHQLTKALISQGLILLPFIEEFMSSPPTISAGSSKKKKY